MHKCKRAVVRTNTNYSFPILHNTSIQYCTYVVLVQSPVLYLKIYIVCFVNAMASTSTIQLLSIFELYCTVQYFTEITCIV